VFPAEHVARESGENVRVSVDLTCFHPNIVQFYSWIQNSINMFGDMRNFGAEQYSSVLKITFAYNLYHFLTITLQTFHFHLL
jgi:hypothetical protein